jgi:hypothetical protein
LPVTGLVGAGALPFCCAFTAQGSPAANTKQPIANRQSPIAFFIINYLGCVIASIMYGSPRFTEATPRLNAACNFVGSLIGPSPAIP